MNRQSLLLLHVLSGVLFCLGAFQKMYSLGSLDTTLVGTDKSQYLTVPWSFDSGASAKGYVTFTRGFSLASNLNFNCNGAVGGDIRLNNSVLNLDSDLFLSNSAQIFGPGVINLKSHAIVLLGKVGINNQVCIDGFDGAVLEGDGKTVDFGASGQFFLRPGASILIDNMTLEGLSGSQILCMDNRGTISWGNVICKMDGNFSFTQGKMYLLDQLDLLGSATFEYASSKECTIMHFGKLFIDKETTFKYAPPVGLGTAADARDLIVMEDDKAEIHLNGGSLSSTRTGLRLTKGTVYVDAHSYIENFEASGPADYNDVEAVCFGNGTPADDLTLRLGSAATLDVLSGKLVMDQA